MYLKHVYNCILRTFYTNEQKQKEMFIFLKIEGDQYHYESIKPNT